MEKIVVIGGVDCSPEAYQIAFEVGYQIIKSKQLLFQGGAGGVGKAALEGGLKALKETNTKPKDRLFSCLPAFRWVDPEDTSRGTIIVMGSNWGERRNLMINHIDGAIAVSGGSGTAHEISLCTELGKPVIPIGGEGSAETYRYEINGDLMISDIHSPKKAVKYLLKKLK